MKVSTFTGRIFSVGLMAWVFSTPVSAKTCDVKAYGAKGDGNTSDTKAIQAAIDDCNAAGGGTVQVDGGTFATGTLIIKSNITLNITKGTILQGTHTGSEYPAIKGNRKCFRCGEAYSLLFSEGTKNITITGGGTVDGNCGSSWGGNRPRLLRFMDVDSLVIRNVSFIRSAYWTTFISGCSNIIIDSLTVNSNTGAGNQDGIDIDDCKHMKMTNSTFTSGDDAVCFKSMKYGDSNDDILIEHCTVLFTRWSAFKMGTETHGGLKNITIRNCTVVQTNSGALCVFSVDGAIVDNVRFENIDIKKSDTPISLRLGTRMRNYNGGPADPKPGSMHNIVFKNITAVGTGSPVGSFISGVPGYIIDGVLLEDLDFTFPGGVTAAGASTTVPPETEDGYPQWDMFKQNMPAYGVYVRHAKNIVFHNIKFRTTGADSRPGIVLEKDVTGVQVLNSISIQKGANAPYAIWNKASGEVPPDFIYRARIPGSKISSGSEAPLYQASGRRLKGSATKVTMPLFHIAK